MFFFELIHDRFIFMEYMFFFSYFKCHNPNNFPKFCQNQIHNIISEVKQVNNELFCLLAVESPKRSLLMSTDQS